MVLYRSIVAVVENMCRLHSHPPPPPHPSFPSHRYIGTVFPILDYVGHAVTLCWTTNLERYVAKGRWSCL